MSKAHKIVLYLSKLLMFLSFSSVLNKCGCIGGLLIYVCDQIDISLTCILMPILSKMKCSNSGAPFNFFQDE